MKHQEQLLQGMRHVDETDLDLSRATVSVTNALRRLRTARETLTRGPLQVIRSRRRRDRLADVLRNLKWLRQLGLAESLAARACQDGRFEEAAHTLVEARKGLGEERT